MIIDDLYVPMNRWHVKFVNYFFDISSKSTFSRNSVFGLLHRSIPQNVKVNFNVFVNCADCYTISLTM